MLLSSPRKKILATYSKKAQRIRSTLPSPTSDDRQFRRQRVTLTSPIHLEHPPVSPSWISLSSSAHSDPEDIEVQQVETQFTQSSKRRRAELSAEPSLDHKLEPPVSPDRVASPVSSSEHDSISDDDPIPVARGRQKHGPRNHKPQPLSKLRKSLNTRPKKLRSIMKRSTSVLSSRTVREIERGADGFDQMHLVLMPVSKPRNMNRKTNPITAALDLLKGPHPSVDFDDPDWSKVPYQDSLIQEQEKALDIAETTKDEFQSVLGITHTRTSGFRSPLMPPTRPSRKEVLLYAQLSSVSAPVTRRSSYDGESENSYANGFMNGEEDEEDEEVLEHRINDAEQEELKSSTVR